MNSSIEQEIQEILSEPEFQEHMRRIIAKRKAREQSQSPAGPIEACEN